MAAGASGPSGIVNLYTLPARDNAGAQIADQRITVDSTAGGVQGTAYTQSYVVTVELDVQDADVMVTFDGSAPTSTNGHRLYAGQMMTWKKERFNAAKFIRQGSTNAAIQVSPSAI
ncbi:MAG TPA: hypothetical protein VEC57_00075 [Candidatus Limnocylindrales bacterium]|nr:hypothetical protein [Candidatus Limnocylindrales bacterium]